MSNITIKQMRTYQVVEIDIENLKLTKLEVLHKAVQELQKEIIRYESFINGYPYRNNEYYGL